MHGDFSRVTFNPAKHFLRVLQQQGRVLLDADWNEQSAIVLHHVRQLTRDLIGDFAGPANALGFKIKPVPETGSPITDLSVGKGRYYVEGLPCENSEDIPKWFGSGANDDKVPTPPFLVYLDVWEQEITAAQEQGIREVALDGPDTTARTRIVWRVRVETPPSTVTDRKTLFDQWTELRKVWQPENPSCLNAQVGSKGSKDQTPCVLSPSSRYRGQENQLYRVEIHDGGAAAATTFKWSRDNGAAVYPIALADGSQVTLTTLGRDDRSTLNVHDWVEVVDDRLVRLGKVQPFARVKDIDRDRCVITLEGPTLPTYAKDDDRHPLLRRWDQQGAADGVVHVTDGWIALENGIQVSFDKDGAYRTGDYWLIPARTVTGDIEWPRDANGAAVKQPPHGIEHSYAPLALVTTTGITDLRMQINELVGVPTA